MDLNNKDFKKNVQAIDGNEACAYSSYALTEVAAIFPITPSTPMAENVDKWSAENKLNIFDQPVKVIEMQSEGGAAGAVHGSLAVGALTTTYTASQGLLLMIPNMYKMAGELLPAVFHVSARAIAAHALSIFGDHQDVMATRQTGFAILSSSNNQEVADLAIIAHLAAIKGRLPFLHFFDGFRTSHEIQKVELVNYEDIKSLVDYQALEEFRKRGLNSEHPTLRGTAQNPDIYFQNKEAANRYYMRLPEIIKEVMTDYSKITGRDYKLYTFYGAQDAENIIVAMGSVCNTIEEVIDYLSVKKEKVGLIKVHLYRPFVKEEFLKVLPKSVKKIAVLDRTKEPGAIGEPLYLDIVQLFYDEEYKPLIVGGRYGLASKDTTPAQILAVYKNLQQEKPKNRFTVGIVDDVTYTSLPIEEEIDTVREGTINCKIWGLGSDGTVGANKSAIKIIGDNTDLYVQGYFEYDSKKSGGTTISHLRFGKNRIKSSYLIQHADYIACHNKSFVNNYDLLKGIKHGGTFVLNCSWSEEELEMELPKKLKKTLAEKNVNFYIIDANKIAQDIGLGGRINMVMQAVFFKLANVIPLEEALKHLKESIEKMYAKKGEKIINMNKEAVDKGIAGLIKVKVNDSWKEENEPIVNGETIQEPDFIKNILRPMARNEGNSLPVSAFVERADGTFPLGTTAYEKRGIAITIPEWQVDNCIECNQCSYVCPHAVIRPFLLTDEEKNNAPKNFLTKQANGKLKEYNYRIQVSTLDCTGCGVCAEVCPAPTKALIMKDAEEQISKEEGNWEYALTLTDKVDEIKDKIKLDTVIGSQFVQPLFEFHGACPGCGETPYIKLLTQLFGDRMVIANATGCSSIYGASAPSIPYTINKKGKGPAWGNSLFEDNAEYGLGMLLAEEKIREQLIVNIRQALELDIDENLKEAFRFWLQHREDGEGSKVAAEKINDLLKNYSNSDSPIIKEIIAKKDRLVKKSFWIIGGDGWAYDIGYGGLDHVIAQNKNINILVMDTEIYSNTGGQSSKSTPMAALAKFAANGKRVSKKDLGLMAMSYGNVYVAQIAMGANMNQTIKAITEAEKYSGPSLIIAYATCIDHGIKDGMSHSMREMKKAVDSGYWHLYRYNPALSEEGNNKFSLDSKEPSKPFRDFLNGEVRYSGLKILHPELTDELFSKAEKDAQRRYELYKKLDDNQIF